MSPEIKALITEPANWVAIAFLIFMFLAFKKIWPIMAKGLDGYAEKIQAEIKNAEELRLQAEAVLKAAKKKSKEAEKDAAEILERAKFEAKLIADEAGKEIEREIEQKIKLADEKIQRAQAAAVENIRKKAVEDAIEAAKETLQKELQTEKTSEKLVENSLRLISSNIS